MISTTLTKHIYNGDGVTKLWSFSFPILEAADISVFLTDAAGAITEITTNFSVDIPNAQVTYPLVGAALAVGTKVTLVRVVDLTQLVDWKRGGAFDSEVLEESLDRVTMQNQQQREAIDRCVKFPVDETPSSADTETFLAEMDATAAAAAASNAAAAASESAAAGSAAATAAEVALAAAQNVIATAQAAIATTKAADATTQAGIATTKAADATTQAGIAAAQASAAAASASTASTQASTATTQAGVATTKAADAATQVGLATAQVALATTQAGSATTQAGVATTQAGIATTKASDAATSAAAAAAALASVGTPLSATGGTMSGDIAMAGHNITGLVDTAITPAAAGATATGTQNRIAQILNQIKTGFGLTNWYDSIANALTAFLLKAGGTMTGAIAMGANKITGLANGTAAGDALAFGQNRILQIVSAITNTSSSVTNASAATNLTATITPSSTSNKVLIIVTIPIRMTGTSLSNGGVLTIKRGATDLSGGNNFAYILPQVSGQAEDQAITLTLLDSPASIGATTYTVWITTNNAGNTLTACVSSSVASITLMEVQP